MNEENSLEKKRADFVSAAETGSKALSDGELEDVTGGVFLRTLEGRVDRRSVAVFPTTLEDKTPNGKKQRRGVRVQTLENRPEDKSTAHTEWL